MLMMVEGRGLVGQDRIEGSGVLSLSVTVRVVCRVRFLHP